MDKKDLGKRIQSMLDSRQISRKEFAAMTGLTEAAISRYCTGAREPRSITLATIANALGVSVDDLLGRPCGSSNELGAAVRLVARSAGKLSSAEKKDLISALIDFTDKGEVE